MLGDSSIDNGYWLLDEQGSNLEEVKQTCVEGCLQAILGSNYRVVSHAVDGFTTNSLLEGDFVGRVLSIRPGTQIPKRLAYLQSKNIDVHAESFFVHPLENLKQAVARDPESTHYVVLSVGGNDFRERLRNPLAMLMEIPSIHTRYMQILDEIKGLGARDIRPIIMTQYRLDAHNDDYGIYFIMKIVGIAFGILQGLSAVGMAVSAWALVAGQIHPLAGAILSVVGAGILYLSSKIIPLSVWERVVKGQELSMATLSGLMEAFYKPILERAKKERIPVLDLPNTFDPTRALYRAQIEPNAAGGRLIASGITHIIQQHNFEGESLLYATNLSRDDTFTASPNPGNSGWRVVA
jgi:hypothetical protein